MRLKHGSVAHHVARRSDTELEVDGVRVGASLIRGENGAFLARGASRITSVFVAREGDRVFAQIGGRSYVLTVVNRSSTISSADAGALGGLEAPMPGRVARVAVAVGDSVKRGQELIVIEAMKMENALVAPSDGVVKSLSVKVGERVAPGSPLIVVEPA